MILKIVSHSLSLSLDITSSQDLSTKLVWQVLSDQYTAVDSTATTSFLPSPDLLSHKIKISKLSSVITTCSNDKNNIENDKNNITNIIDNINNNMSHLPHKNNVNNNNNNINDIKNIYSNNIHNNIHNNNNNINDKINNNINGNMNNMNNINISNGNNNRRKDILDLAESADLCEKFSSSMCGSSEIDEPFQK